MTNKLTKVKIRQWLEVKRESQIDELINLRDAEVQAYKIDFVKKHGFTALCEKYEPIIRAYKKEWDVIYDKLFDEGNVERNYWGTTSDKLDSVIRFIENQGGKEREELCISDENYTKIKSDYKDQIVTVREEWNKLISNVNTMTSVKKILAYLDELGIDTSEIKPVEEPMLPATPIEVSILKL